MIGYTPIRNWEEVPARFLLQNHQVLGESLALSKEQTEWYACNDRGPEFLPESCGVGSSHGAHPSSASSSSSSHSDVGRIRQQVLPFKYNHGDEFRTRPIVQTPASSQLPPCPPFCLALTFGQSNGFRQPSGYSPSNEQSCIHSLARLRAFNKPTRRRVAAVGWQHVGQMNNSIRI